MTEAPSPDGDAREDSVDELTTRLRSNREEIDDLIRRADASDRRADASDARADAHEAETANDRERITMLEKRAEIDRELMAELQAEGVLSKQNAANLEEALRSSRTIGAAIGIVMAERRVGEDEAFGVLKKASSVTNRKLRLVADDVVQTGDVASLPPARPQDG
ncbi:ANTAR domain-containing protein [Angustibacter peucedani]